MTYIISAMSQYMIFIGVWQVSQNERLFVYPRHYSDQYQRWATINKRNRCLLRVYMMRAFAFLILVRQGYLKDYLHLIHSSLNTMQGPSCRGKITLVSTRYQDGIDPTTNSSTEEFPRLIIPNKYQYTIGITILVLVGQVSHFIFCIHAMHSRVHRPKTTKNQYWTNIQVNACSKQKYDIDNDIKVPTLT